MKADKYFNIKKKITKINLNDLNIMKIFHCYIYCSYEDY